MPKIDICRIVVDSKQLPLASIQTQLLDHGVEANTNIVSTVGCWEGGNVGGPPVEKQYNISLFYGL